MPICRTAHEYWHEFKGPTTSPRPAPVVDRPQRVTLRLPSALRRCVEASAALEGVTVDAWVARALARSVDPRVGT